MPSIEVRPFRRSDREQLAELVNAHVGAVLPGVSVSVNAVLSQLEREPGEFLVDPWVAERATFVALERARVVAAVLVVRYGAEPEVSVDLRGAGELRWVVCWPASADAGSAVVDAALEQLARWSVVRRYADGALPAVGVYGIPECWPHVRTVLRRAGFAPGERVEIVLAAPVADLPTAPAAPPVPDLRVARVVGGFATRFVALTADDAVAGFVEVAADLTAGGTLSRLDGWADVWELHVAEAHRRQGIGTWLLAHAADWLRLAGARVLRTEVAPLEEGAAAELAFLRRHGFRELTRTTRGWSQPAG